MSNGGPSWHQDQEWHDNYWQGWRQWRDNSWQQDQEWRDNSWTGWRGNSWDPQSRTTLGGIHGAGNATAVVDNPGWDQWPVTVADNATTVAGARNATAVADNATTRAGAGDATALADNATAGGGIVTQGQPPGSATDGAALQTGQLVFDLAFFCDKSQTMAQSMSWTDNYKQHNAALKYIRDKAEADGDDVVHFDHHSAHPVNPSKRWSWQEMVAQLDDPSMRRVVQGIDFRSRGIVSCRLQKTPRYDHKRHHAAKGAPPPAMLHIWDFVLTLENGREVWLHPEYASPKFGAYFERPAEDYEIPRTGKGGTNGPGTYRYFKHKVYNYQLRFDATNKYPATSNRGRGKGGKKGKLGPLESV